MVGETLLTIQTVASRVCLSKATIYARIAKGAFPRPIQLSVRAVRWKQSEVDEWINSRPRTKETVR